MGTKENYGKSSNKHHRPRQASVLWNGLFEGLNASPVDTVPSGSKQQGSPEPQLKRKPRKPSKAPRPTTPAASKARKEDKKPKGRGPGYRKGPKLDSDAERKLRSLTKVPSVVLCGVDNDKGGSSAPVAELLCVVSWRETIIAIPKAVIPHSRGGWKTFSLGPGGRSRPPREATKPILMGFMDTCHLEDQTMGGGPDRPPRYAVLRVYANRRCVMYELPKITQDKDGKFHPHPIRKAMTRGAVYRTLPLFEVPTDWYYDELFRRLGGFLKLGNPVTATSMIKYYQYMTMPLGQFVEMYGYSGDLEHEEVDADASPDEEHDEEFTLRELVDPLPVVPSKLRASPQMQQEPDETPGDESGTKEAPSAPYGSFLYGGVG